MRTSNYLSTYPQKYPNQSETVKCQDPTGESKINNAIVAKNQQASQTLSQKQPSSSPMQNLQSQPENKGTKHL